MLTRSEARRVFVERLSEPGENNFDWVIKSLAAPLYVVGAQIRRYWKSGEDSVALCILDRRSVFTLKYTISAYDTYGMGVCGEFSCNCEAADGDGYRAPWGCVHVYFAIVRVARECKYFHIYLEDGTLASDSAMPLYHLLMGSVLETCRAGDNLQIRDPVVSAWGAEDNGNGKECAICLSAFTPGEVVFTCACHGEFAGECGCRCMTCAPCTVRCYKTTKKCPYCGPMHAWNDFRFPSASGPCSFTFLGRRNITFTDHWYSRAEHSTFDLLEAVRTSTNSFFSKDPCLLPLLALARKDSGGDANVGYQTPEVCCGARCDCTPLCVRETHDDSDYSSEVTGETVDTYQEWAQVHDEDRTCGCFYIVLQRCSYCGNNEHSSPFIPRLCVEHRALNGYVCLLCFQESDFRTDFVNSEFFSGEAVVDTNIR